jgi:hypothetical protein
VVRGSVLRCSRPVGRHDGEFVREQEGFVKTVNFES